MFSMKTVWLVLPLVAALACVLAAGGWISPPVALLPAQDEAPPGAVHERLMKLAGKWTSATKFAMPGAPAAETAGEATFTSILGGRFLQSEEKGTMMGQPFESRKMYGYNASSKRYEGLWVYTGSTAMMTLAGASKDDGKTIAFDASYEQSPGKRESFEITFTDLGADKFSIVMKSKAGEDGKSATMETVYTRKK
jgi:hypothetical protein